MNDGRWLDHRKSSQKPFTLTNVEFEMAKGLLRRLQPIAIPGSITLQPKKLLSHIIIDSMHAPSALTKESDYFAAD
jgi:hypothetical protein